MVSRYFTTLFHELQQKYVWFYISGCGEGISGCGERIIRMWREDYPEKNRVQAGKGSGSLDYKIMRHPKGSKLRTYNADNI